MTKIRNLILVLGDQLNHDSDAFTGFDAANDRVWMAENQNEATHVWCHQYRLVAFFSAMRHFRDELRASGKKVLYHELPPDGRKARVSSFGRLLGGTLQEHGVEKLVVTHPGDHRVLEELRTTADAADVPLEIRDDHHFYCSLDRFEDWADSRKSFVLEQFYRVMRREHGVLIDTDGDPEGGEWNFDKSNRDTFGRTGPTDVPPVPHFDPDSITRDVMAMVEKRFADHPGSLAKFNLPVTRDAAREALDDFVRHRLPRFGNFQDAMWTDEEFLYHSRLSHAINVHLLSPREVVDAAVAAYRDDAAPINCVEGFVRQILGWREYVRGIYWLKMPEYATRNSLNCSEDQDVPDFFWDGETQMACVGDAMRLLIDHAYAHHIQRLMVLGLFAQLYGTHPANFNNWHMAMYADAIDWVSLPNALGMSQHGDDGLMATKPYCASGKYIDRMSNHCKSCRYKPGVAVGDDACPFTTLYWDFLDRHRETFRGNTRMMMQIKNVERKKDADLDAIRERALGIRRGEIEV